MALSVPHVKVHLQLNNKSGVNEDNTIWTLYYRPPGGTLPIDPGSGSVAVDNLAQALENFLSEVPTGFAESVSGYLAASVLHGANGATMKLYGIPTTPVAVLGPPIATRNLAVAGVETTTGLPTEVASCLTYHADLKGIPERGPNNTRPASSRRGRIFIGPLQWGCLEHDVNTGFARAHPTFRGVVTEAAAEHLFAEADNASWRWVVFSKKNWEAHEVAGCWMNDAMDTQRRRGQDPTVKTVRPF